MASVDGGPAGEDWYLGDEEGGRPLMVRLRFIWADMLWCWASWLVGEGSMRLMSVDAHREKA